MFCWEYCDFQMLCHWILGTIDLAYSTLASQANGLPAYMGRRLQIIYHLMAIKENFNDKNVSFS